MSKAFVNDDQAASDVQRPLPVGRRPITPSGAAQQRATLKALVEHELPALRAALARAEPDAQRSYERAQRRAVELERIISLSDVVQAAPAALSHVTFGAKVTVRDEESGTSLSYSIVGPDEVDVEARCISHISPVGRALLGRKIGERVFIKRPAGTLEVVVAAIAMP